ncbi:MAG TPA: ATP-binding protein [Candidatus Acidoferrales bacterium]|nr:ATP-binding protein [Candidatus Acidoferrales bacterium]
MDELVQIVANNFDAIADRWVASVGTMPKYFGSTQISFYKSQITELLHCIVDLLVGVGPSRLIRFTERIVKPPYNGLLTLTSVHETFLLGEDSIISVVKEKMERRDDIFEYSRRVDGCFHEIIYQYANAYQSYQAEVSASQRKVIEQQRETLMKFTNAIGSANSYDEALSAGIRIIKEESRSASVEFFAFEATSQCLTFRLAVPEETPTASGDFLRALANQFGSESSARRSYGMMQEISGHRKLVLMLPVSAGESLIGLLLLAFLPVPMRESSISELSERIPLGPEESLNVLLAMVDQLGYGLKRFLLEEEVISKARYISILTENSADAIVGLDEQGKIASWNKGATLLFGFQPAEVNGEPFSVLLPGEKRMAGEVTAERIRSEGIVRNFELECVTKSGHRVTVSLTGSILRDEQGISIGEALIMRDVTQLKQYEQELRQTEKLSFIGQISAGIAHEIGTPLNIILGNAEYLMMDLKPNEEGYDELKMIAGETNRIAKLIQQLLDFARPKKMRTKQVDLNSEINAVLQLMKSQIDKSSIELELDLEKNLPLVFGDAAQLQEVFVNLIVNAIHSMENIARNAVGPRLSIKTEIARGKGDNVVEVTIADTGCGISEEDLEKIFNPFFTTKEVGKGTGLGLAITQRIIQDHKGAISVESNVGKGTIFKLSFPAYDVIAIEKDKNTSIAVE